MIPCGLVELDEGLGDRGDRRLIVDADNGERHASRADGSLVTTFIVVDDPRARLSVPRGSQPRSSSPSAPVETVHETLMFLTKEAARLALEGTAVGTACEGCPPLPDLMARYEAAAGRYHVCPICFHTKKLDKVSLIAGAELPGTVPLWQWIGDEPATTFCY